MSEDVEQRALDNAADDHDRRHTPTPTPQVVETARGLESLPNWTVARQDMGVILEQRSSERGPAAWYGYMGGTVFNGQSSQWIADKIGLSAEYPVTVLYPHPTPDVDVLAEVRARLVQLRDHGDTTSGYDAVVACLALLNPEAGR